MKEKIVIYTAIIGSYDSLIQPFTPAEGFDFVCFVPQGMKKEDNVGYWHIEELPVSWSDNTLTARFPKLNPQSVLEGYNWSLWIDGNIAIRDESIYSICRMLQGRNVQYAGVKHPVRDCTYEEAETILRNGRERLWTVLGAVRFLHSKGLKRHAGLQETNIIFRKHNDQAVLEFDRWWWECLVKYSSGHRDQLMHTFCLLDTPSLTWVPLFPEGKSTRDFPGVEYRIHKGLHNPSEKPWLQRKFIYFFRALSVSILRFYLRLFVR